MGGRNPVADLIADQGWCVADGATGSNFFGRGLEAGYPPELWCLEKPEEVAALHDAFLNAGADLILTNRFLHMMAAEEGMKKLKHDIDIYSDSNTIIKKKEEEEGITARGNRDLMKDIQAEIQDVEFNDEDNE